VAPVGGLKCHGDDCPDGVDRVCLVRHCRPENSPVWKLLGSGFIATFSAVHVKS
jgi:hypothetical protein